MNKPSGTGLVIWGIKFSLLGITVWTLTPYLTMEAMKHPIGREIIFALKPLLKLGGW